MSGGSFIAPDAPVLKTVMGRAWEMVSDILLVMALLWTIPVALAMAAALFRLVRNVL